MLDYIKYIKKDKDIDFTKLTAILNQYAKELDPAENEIAIKGKMLSEANREQASLIFTYGQRKGELKILHDYMEDQLEICVAKLHKSYFQKENRTLSDRQVEKYVKTEERYLNMLEATLAVRDMLSKYQNVIDSFNARGYALKNLTDLYIAQINDTIV